MSCLISYLSSSGGLLEALKVSSPKWPFNVEEVAASVGTSCPKLTRLVCWYHLSFSMETLRRLYEQCPHLQDVSIGSVEINGQRKSVSIRVKGHNEDWAICLSHALRRRQYKTVTLDLREDYNHRVGNLKSILEPCHIEVDVVNFAQRAYKFETSLISLLQDLPHLNTLHLLLANWHPYTDATLAAISEHANSLTELRLTCKHFTDKSMSELIKTCQLLKRLTICYDGRVSRQYRNFPI
eukprot:scaffold954_cov173-Ochromonas_danica.AAC.20